MSKVVVADSSCLIGLSKIGKLDVLHRIFGSILIPKAVYHEVVVLGAGKAGSDDVKQAKWITTCAVENELAIKAFRLNLGMGESEAIALAVECQADFIILDDSKAKQAAETLGISVIGTVAVLKKAVEKGVISEDVPTILGLLHRAGFRFLL